MIDDVGGRSVQRHVRALAKVVDTTAELAVIVQEGRVAFMDSRRSQHAACYGLFIVGEAVKRDFMDSFTALHPEIPWRSVAGLRNRLSHEYDRGNVDLVWATLERDVPVLSGVVRDELDRLSRRA